MDLQCVADRWNGVRSFGSSAAFGIRNLGRIVSVDRLHHRRLFPEGDTSADRVLRDVGDYGMGAFVAVYGLSVESGRIRMGEVAVDDSDGIRLGDFRIKRYNRLYRRIAGIGC